jgi:putative salt-induced outer membrane protein YdiY
MITLYPSRDMVLAGLLAVALLGSSGETRAQGATSEAQLGWSNSTTLSVVVAEGNAKTQSFGFDNRLRRHWKQANFQLKLNLFQTNEADDRFLQIEPGLTWLPGEEQPPGSTSVVEPPIETEAARLFVEGKYDREIRESLYWSAGASWDRNEDAGILNRYIAFGGLGKIWWKREDLNFQTVWGLSYTDREEDDVDPEKDDRFGGLRFSWEYMNKWGKLAVYENDFTANMSLKDADDYSLNMTNSISVDLSSHLALKVSLQGLFENEPALEDVDVVARIQLRDPDDIPGSGDEFFETVETGGSELVVRSEDIRRDQVDMVFRTSLVISF